MAKKHPHIQFYTGDWKKDPALSLCSLATRGAWIDLLCSMHDGRVGQVTGTPAQLAQLCRCDAASMLSALLELQSTRAANVSERDGIFTVACRRMIKALNLSMARATAGSKGAANREQKPDTDNDIECLRIVEEFCTSIGLPKSDGTACFHKWQGNGWTNKGEPIRCWKSTIRSWERQGFLPSQKNGAVPGKLIIKKPKDARDIPDQMKSWLIEKDPSTRDKWDEWKVMGDVPDALRGMWFAHRKKEKELAAR